MEQFCQCFIKLCHRQVFKGQRGNYICFATGTFLRVFLELATLEGQSVEIVIPGLRDAIFTIPANQLFFRGNDLGM